MAEPLKTLIGPALVATMSEVLARLDGFDRAAFRAEALAGLDRLEMMARAAQITAALRQALPPAAFPARLEALARLLHPETEAPEVAAASDTRGLRGWALLPVGTLVAEDGLDHPEESLVFLRQMTMRFTAEFAVRPFFRDHTALALRHAARWAADANLHVRRLASEGSRPRLPWGLRLKAFVDDPAPLLPILERLRDDPEEYVRRSVANNLNDIARDHPDLVSGIAHAWLADAPQSRRRLVRHACRGLVKAGHPATLAVLGYGPPDGVRADLSVSPATVRLGETLTISLALTAPRPLPVLIDLVLLFRKGSGALSPKVFKWTESRLPAHTPLCLEKRLPLRDVTTRRHYSGRQGVAVQVNGVRLAEISFDLQVPGDRGQ